MIAESIFSIIKRMYGEYVTAIRSENMIRKMMLKVSLYNWFNGIIVTYLLIGCIKRSYKRVPKQSKHKQQLAN